MSKRDSQLLLGDIIESVRKIDRYRAGLSKSDFLIDDKTSDAVIRNLEIIGEAVRQLPSEFKDSHTGIPWSQIAGLRNRIVHDYAGVDLELVWEIVEGSLPELLKEIGKLSDL